MNKPMIGVDDLILHMKSKGIAFTEMSEEDAKAYLHKNNNYFKLTSYRKNYTKCMQGSRTGQYEKLDFAYLVELARIDVQLRQTILGMCLDIEHFLKVQLIRAIEQDPNEDGYSIVLDYVFDSGNTTFAERAHNASPRAHAISSKLEKNKNNPYCGGLITKYNGEMPVWVFIEIISFGDLLRFVEYVSNKINWTLPVDIKTLDRVRQIRNAAAHNNCIINDLTPNYKTGTKTPECNEPVYITQFVRSAGVAKTTMQKKLSNRRFSQIIHLLYAFDVIVTSSNSRQLRFTELKNLVNTGMLANKKYFMSNQVLDSTYRVLSSVVNNLH
jgi:abortive infection bacteriophage resistance protein